MGTLAPFLRPEGFACPPLHAALQEWSVVGETGRYLRRAWTGRGERGEPGSRVPRADHPVVLVPGFMSGDSSVSLLAGTLRAAGFRTYRSHIRANVGCTVVASAQLERRIESVVHRRDRRVLVVGHSLGGMLARGLAVRRPDLIAGIVTLGSPMLAPAAHHASLTRSVELLIRLGRAGIPGLMSEDCVAGTCARASFAETRSPLAAEVAFTAIYSRRDGIVDWRACVDPIATAVEVTASHTGMLIDPLVADVVLAALVAASDASLPMRSVLEVDRGVGA